MRRQHNAERVSAAIAAARNLLAWLEREDNDPLKRIELELPATVATSITRAPRIQARKYAIFPMVVKTFMDRPEIAPWFASPSRIRNLSVIAGSVRCAQLIRGLIQKDDIQAVVDQIGDSAWQLARDEKGDGVAMGVSPQSVVHRISNEGERIMHHFIKAVFPDLYSDLERNCNASWSRHTSDSDGSEETASILNIVQVAAP